MLESAYLNLLMADFDEEEPEVDFSQDKDIKPERKAFEVDYRVYGPKDILAIQDKQVQEVCDILGQPPESTAILLRRYRWNKEKLIENYMDNEDAVLEESGLGTKSNEQPKSRKMKGFTCGICLDDEAGVETYSMKCGHRFCMDCYQTYIEGKVGEEGEATRIQCPKDGCKRIVDSKTLDFLIPTELKPRY